LGCRTVSHYVPLQWKYQEVFGSNYGFGTPCAILDRTEEIQAAFKLVADEESRAELLRQIHWRMALEPDRLVEHWQPNETYFPPEIQPLADEVFVDCGAFTGDSIAAFLDHRGYSFRKALGVEPDPGNCEKMMERFSHSPKRISEKISALPYAVGSSNRTLHFDVRGSAASRVSESATEVVECRTLDTLLASEEPTYIKMDIEGTEPDAIAGAAKTIQTHRPVLAICLYHQLDHLWRVPIALHQLNPDYKLLIRRYAEDCWELVCYAVPGERLL
jgi:FkbM family methyltransferase